MKKMQNNPEISIMAEMALAPPHRYHTQKVGNDSNSAPSPETCGY